LADLTLNRAQKRYLLVDLAIGAAIVNLVLNVGLGWLILRGREGIAMSGEFGEPSLIGELLGTCLLLPFFTGIIVTPLVKMVVRKGRVPAVEWQRTDHPWLARLPRGTFARSVVVGVSCMVVIAMPIAVILTAVGLEWLDFRDYLIAKGVFSGLLAAPVTPLFGICALADAER
jgi:hypothetical protein